MKLELLTVQDDKVMRLLMMLALLSEKPKA